MQFKDLNFKISVTGALHDLGYYNEEAKKIKDENSDWDQDNIPIPAVVEYYKNLNIDPKHLAEIESFQPDGGDLCYQYLFKVWDGEDNQFDISSIEGIENLTNLKSFEPISMVNENGLDYSPLLLCENLETVSSEFINDDETEILKKLQDKGIEIN